MHEDELAIRCVISGDRNAFRPLVERHQSAVCATVRALLPHFSDWEDIAQEVFLAAFRHLATFDAERGSFRAWLLAIARNQCRNVRPFRSPNHVNAIPERIDSRSPEASACEAEWFERLNRCLAALPDEQRLAFVLVEMQGLSYAEAADISAATVGTVKSRLFRAKQWLREIMRTAANDDQCPATGQLSGLQRIDSQRNGKQ
jgi:RNA polymerase sigma-70 factor (ECF subfamily)